MNVLEINILTQILRTLLTFIALLILRTVSFCGGWFFFCVTHYVKFQFALKEWSMNDIMVNIIELECLMLIFIHFNSKFKITCTKNWDLIVFNGYTVGQKKNQQQQQRTNKTKQKKKQTNRFWMPIHQSSFWRNYICRFAFSHENALIAILSN